MHQLSNDTSLDLMRYARPDVECLDDQVASSGAPAALMDQLQPLVQRSKPILSWAKVLLWSIFSLVLLDDADDDNDDGNVAADGEYG